MRRKRVAAIVLAAGQSTRMGRPKMLLPWKGTTVLGQVVAELAEGLGTDSSTDFVADSRIRTDSSTDFVADSRIRTDSSTDFVADSRMGADSSTDFVTDSRIGPDSSTDFVADSRIGTDSSTDFVTDSRIGTDGKTDKRMGADFEIVVVTGAEREQVEGLVGVLAEGYAVRCVFNPAYKTGEMLSSLQCGLAGLGPEVDAALIALGDQPRVESSTARRIVEAFESSGARIIVPSYQMRRGHPWLVERSLWAEIAAMKAPQTPRDFLNTHADEIMYVNVNTPTVLEDMDTPEDYARLSR